MTEADFQKKYRGLNMEQKEAVDTIAGQVMVVAGPGTGKTTILTLRIANILRQTDTPPDAILALTFSESGAHAMREKLAAIVGSTAYRVRISTFHGFGSDIIQNHPGSFPRIVGSRPASEIDQIRIVEEIIRKNSFREIKPFGDIFYYVRPALQAITDLKKEGFDPEKFSRWLKSWSADRRASDGGTNGRRERRSRELLAVFRLYEKALHRRKLYDYDDMLIETIKVLKKDKNLLAEIRERSHFILADEHQDSNSNQNELLELIAGKNPDLFIVGDEKQAIYRFQGASLENFLYFRRRFPAAKLIVLKESYRSTNLILEAAHSIAEKLLGANEIPRPKLKNPRSNAPRRPINEFSFPDAETEARFVAKEVARLSRTGRQSVGIFVRRNADVLMLSRQLEEAGVDFVTRADQNIFDDADFHNFFSYLEAITDPTDDDRLAEAMLADFAGLDPVSVFKIFRESRRARSIGKSGGRTHPMIDGLLDQRYLSGIGVSPGPIIAFAQKISRLAGEARNATLIDFLNQVVAESGLRDKLIAASNSPAKIERLSALYGAARSFSETSPTPRLHNFVLFLKSARNFEVRLPSVSRPNPARRVELMTAHKAKGLEFDIVFIVGATDALWGGRGRPALFELPPAIAAEDHGESGEADERRLFFVALTRARHTLYITRPSWDANGRPLPPSRFIEDINPELLNQKAFETARLENRIPASAGKKESGRPTKKEREYLRQIFLSEGLTVTALNNYLDCPWRFFFQNLIRLPSAPEKQQEYGSAIHEALKVFQNAVRTGERPSVTLLVSMFDSSISRRSFEPGPELNSWKNRGRKSLRVFFRNREWRSEAIPELALGGVLISLPEGQTIALHGVLDEVIFLPNGQAIVTDFKTGKPRSRNDMLGRTKLSTGAYFRQLVFYKLLLEQSRKNISVPSGAIEFVEPDPSGRYRREEFLLTGTDVETLKKEIEQVGGEILALSFWDEECDREKCEFCELAENLRSQKN